MRTTGCFVLISVLKKNQNLTRKSQIRIETEIIWLEISSDQVGNHLLVSRNELADRIISAHSSNKNWSVSWFSDETVLGLVCWYPGSRVGTIRKIYKASLLLCLSRLQTRDLVCWFWHMRPSGTFGNNSK